MHNIPVFDTPYGIASLVLKEIPYSSRAYITVQSSLDLDKLLSECVSFCRAVGSEQIYAKGHNDLRKYPVWIRVLQMQIEDPSFGETSAVLEPVTEATLRVWVDTYNQKMASVDNASYMTERDAKEMLSQKDGYFVSRAGKTLGILMASDGELCALASCVPGAGAECLRALIKHFSWKCVKLEVASTNERALRLYKSLGFAEMGVVSTWYKIV